MPPRLRIVTGKGGVGKTVCATAMALAAARAGRRVLLAEVAAGDRVCALLGHAPTAAQMREVVENLWVVDMSAQEAMREYALLVLRFEAVYKAVFGNRLVRHFVNLVPSLGELTMLGKLWYHERQEDPDRPGRPRFDLIVLDAPATGHAISMLRTPAGVADTVPAGALRDNCMKIHELFVDAERSVLHVVTTPEEMPVNEAVELEQAATDLVGMRLGVTFINQRVPGLPAATLEHLQPLAADPGASEAFAALRIRAGKVAAGEEHLRRLPARMLSRACSLPRLVGAHFATDEVTRLADVMAACPDLELGPAHEPVGGAA